MHIISSSMQNRKDPKLNDCYFTGNSKMYFSHLPNMNCYAIVIYGNV